MARKRKTGVKMSLFPFLSVLVCVIGALTLMIISTTLGSSLEGETETQVTVTPEQVEGATLRGMQSLLAVKIKMSEEQLAKILKKLREITDLQGALAGPQATHDGLKKTASSLEDQIKSLLAKLAEATRKLDAVKKGFKPRGRSRTKITVAAAIRGKHKYNPLFVDCRKDGILILQNGRRIATKDIEKSSYVRKLLGNVRTSGNWCLYMLIRKDGVKSFVELCWEARQTKIPYGYCPVLSKDDFDVGDWKKADWLKP